jgi:hypothetical protein
MGSGGIAPLLLTSTLDGGEWPDSRLGRFTRWEKFHDTHCTGGQAGPRAGLEVMEKRKSYLCRESNPGRLARRDTD